MFEPYFSRIGKVDFLGSLPPGFYVVLATTISITAIFTNQCPKQAWGCVADLSVSAAWFLSILLLFGSHIVGGALRAIPVGVIDGFGLRLIRRFSKQGHNDRRETSHRQDWKKLLYRDDFPYPRALQGNSELLADSGIETSVTHVDRMKPGNAMIVFDFWKTGLRALEPNTFASIQSFEARVRLFAGMIWAGLMALVLASAALCFSGGPSLRLARDIPVFLLLLVLWSLSCIAGRIAETMKNPSIGASVIAHMKKARLLKPLLLGLREGTGAYRFRQHIARCLLRVMWFLVAINLTAKKTCADRFRRRIVWFVPAINLVVLTLLFFIYRRDDPWHHLAFAMLLVSLLLVGILGARLRHVRGEEANEVFLAYLAQAQKTEKRSDRLIVSWGPRHRRRR